jgi:hypothetical protein
MAAQKPVQLVSGRLTEVSAMQASAGAGDAGKIVALDGTGRIDMTMMPVGIGSDTSTMAASENLTAGDFVNVFNDGGIVKARKAIGDVAGKESDGFVLANVTSGNTATVYFEGTNTQVSGYTIGARYYLSAGTAGVGTATPPSGSGNVVQYLGRATSATSLSFEPDAGVVLA